VDSAVEIHDISAQHYCSNVPALAEAGYPYAESSFWVGLSVPANTPREIIDRLHKVVEEPLQAPTVKNNLAKLGVEPQLMSVEQFGKFFKRDLAATVQLASDAHIEPTD
jgi:tripartite-type tricarboxylate transporter receptor subunit TctC